MTCKCFSTMNEKLKPYNAQLAGNLFDYRYTLVETWRIEKGRGTKKPPIVVASYCPFCGKKHKHKKTKTA